MKYSKRIAGILATVAMISALSVSAFAADYTVSKDFELPDPVVRTEGVMPRYAWITYSSEAITGGSWYGGIQDDGGGASGVGTIVSCAESSSVGTRVYTQAGSNASKNWSAWALPGETSIEMEGAALSGNKCGYQIR